MFVLTTRTKHSPNDGVMLGQRRRRWPNITLLLGECFVRRLNRLLYLISNQPIVNIIASFRSQNVTYATHSSGTCDTPVEHLQPASCARYAALSVGLALVGQDAVGRMIGFDWVQIPTILTCPDCRWQCVLSCRTRDKVGWKNVSYLKIKAIYSEPAMTMHSLLKVWMYE